MVMPPGWSMKAFHGEQVSSRKEEVTPQYLSPNDQMIYHLTVATTHEAQKLGQDAFEFEAEYTPLGKQPATARVEAKVAEMVKGNATIVKGDAIVAYAEMLKKMKLPLDDHRDANLAELDKALAEVETAQKELEDAELATLLAQLEQYRRVIKFGEQLLVSRDKDSDAVDAALGLSTNSVVSVKVSGTNPGVAVKAMARLGSSTRLVPTEGHKFLVLSSGPVWNSSPAGGGQLGGNVGDDPTPDFLGSRPAPKDRRPIFDLHRVELKLKAPKNARSFSFDFNFFSAEYPGYVQQNYNDTFYATLQAPSTNRGKPTNVSFDPNNNSIEVDNNYFQQPFHPIPNTGTGFDHHGSTGWLRTSWPVAGGEELTLSFTIHDEGDGVYDSLVVLDNFRWNEFAAVGNTDPLN
jgi:hypothetical protein